MSRPIRNSAKALIIREGKMAAVRLREGDEEWYILPGGGQEAEELLPEAVCREVAEELGLLVEPVELAFVVEGRCGEPFHRVDLVFLCACKGELPNARLKADTNQTGMDWLEIDSLDRAPLYPSRLRRQIMRLHRGEQHRVYLGNEEAGDPVCLD
ncbi:MAG: NUDIX domain-containing protein [Eubacteriales bacterium]|nr:NUDIX domain-containing protein [Eubacteriales bacterium]